MPRPEYVLYIRRPGCVHHRSTVGDRWEEELFLEFCAIKFMQSLTTNKMAASYGTDILCVRVSVYNSETLNYKNNKTFN